MTSAAAAVIQSQKSTWRRSHTRLVLRDSAPLRDFDIRLTYLEEQEGPPAGAPPHIRHNQARGQAESKRRTT